jgi:transketolase
MDIKALEKVALSCRALSMDAIQKANSGHPGLPMGAAELGAILYGEILKHDPADPAWVDRDRFVLSAGHGSMFLYSYLYLSGYKGLTLDDIKNFRQIGSPCAGHPEYGMIAGIETTTGPLGQGIATAVGMAIAESTLAAQFNTSGRKIVDHYTYALVGDGCLQEGVSAEACSLAGHLKLGKLICYYDSNQITIDGRTDLSFTEDVGKRYEAYGWQVLKGSMYDFEEIARLTAEAKKESGKPTLIILTSIIGKGSPNKANTSGIHGAPLGADELALTKQSLGIPSDFYVAPEAETYFKAKQEEWKKNRAAWQAEFDAWAKENPELKKEWDAYFSGKVNIPEMPQFEVGSKMATRTAGTKNMEPIAKANRNLMGGAADLKGPNAVTLGDAKAFTPATPEGRYIYYGIREFGMAAISNGIQLHGGLRAFCATFMVFADYLRSALRLSALMKQPVIYVLTHDSILIGEDGPTHQPIETLISLRAIPNVTVLRPADAEEAREAWIMAMENKDGPTCLIMSRQDLIVFEKADPDWKNMIRTGAYIAKKVDGTPDVVVIASGSEVNLALAAAEKSTKKVQVVSMMSRELFESQPEAIQNAVVPSGARVVTCEAGSRMGWERWAKLEDIMSIDQFGESGPSSKVAAHFGFTSDALAALINK